MSEMDFSRSAQQPVRIFSVAKGLIKIDCYFMPGNLLKKLRDLGLESRISY